MRDYTPVELPEQPFQTTIEEQNFTPEEQEIPTTEHKKKRKLSQKQIDALAKGRAKVAENRAKKREQLQTKKLTQKTMVKAVEVPQPPVSLSVKKVKGKKEKEIFDRLKAKEAQELKNYKKVETFIGLREKFLGECETIEDFEDLSRELDTITEEDILNDELLLKKLNKMLVNYK